jgi:hypothetical protein
LSVFPIGLKVYRRGSFASLAQQTVILKSGLLSQLAHAVSNVYFTATGHGVIFANFYHVDSFPD